MIVLDTHAWLWWTSSPERLSSRARDLLAGVDAVGVCTISCWEVAMLVLRGRISLDRDVRSWVRSALARERVESIALSPEIAIDAALLEQQGYPGDPADRIIYASARARGATIVTKDEPMRAFDAARALW